MLTRDMSTANIYLKRLQDLLGMGLAAIALAAGGLLVLAGAVLYLFGCVGLFLVLRGCDLYEFARKPKKAAAAHTGARHG